MSDAAAKAVWSPDLAELGAFLRGRGVNVGTGEILRAAAVLRAAGDRPDGPRTLSAAVRWLAPVLATSEAEQLLLPSLLAAYDASVRQASAEEVAAGPAQEAGDAAKSAGGARSGRFLKWSWMALAGVVLLGLLLWFGLGAPAADAPQTTLLPPPESLEKMTAPPWLLAVLSFVPNGDAAGKAVPFSLLPVFAWWVVRRWRGQRRSVIDRRPDPGTMEKGLVPPSSRLCLFAPAGLSWAIQAMRAHRMVSSASLDVTATVLATARAAGRFVPMPGQRPHLPDYPVVVEVLCAGDHLLMIGEAIADCLAEGQVPHQLYTGRDGLDYVRDGDGDVSRLSDLSIRHGGDLLLIVSDGDSVLGPGGRALGPVLQAALEQWSGVVLLTPVPVWRWSWRERFLAENGVIVLPATPAGLNALGDYLRAGKGAESPRPALRQSLARPGPLARESRTSLRWHSDRPPSRSERDAVLDAIALEVPGCALELARVLALFPEVRPDLTLHVAEQLLRAAEMKLGLDEEALGALAALPWFRFGRFPNWLRADLVRDLTPARLSQAEGIYKAWLQPTGQGNTGWYFKSETFAKSVAQAAKDMDSPLQDVIFLRFSRGETLEDTATLEAPEAMARELRSPFFSVERFGLCLALCAGLGVFVVVTESFAKQTLGQDDDSDKSVVLVLMGLMLLGASGWIWQMVQHRARRSRAFYPWPAIIAAVATTIIVWMLKRQPDFELTNYLIFVILIFPFVFLTMLPLKPMPESALLPSSLFHGQGSRFSSPLVILLLILLQFLGSRSYARDAMSGLRSADGSAIVFFALEQILTGWVFARQFRSNPLHCAIASGSGAACGLVVCFLTMIVSTDNVADSTLFPMASLCMAMGGQLGPLLWLQSKGTVSLQLWPLAVMLPATLLSIVLVVSLQTVEQSDVVVTAALIFVLATNISFHMLSAWVTSPPVTRSGLRWIRRAFAPAVISRFLLLLYGSSICLFVAARLVSPLFARPTSVSATGYAVAITIACVLAQMLVPRAARLAAIHRSTGAREGLRDRFRPALRAIGSTIVDLAKTLPRGLLFIPLLPLGFYLGPTLSFLPITILPAAAFAALWLGRDAVAVVAVGGLPLVLGVRFGAYGTIANLGVYFLALALAFLIAAPEWRRRLLATKPHVLQVTAMASLLPCGLLLDLVSGKPHVWLAVDAAPLFWAGIVALGFLQTQRSFFYNSVVCVLAVHVTNLVLLKSLTSHASLGFAVQDEVFQPVFAVANAILVFETSGLLRKAQDGLSSAQRAWQFLLIAAAISLLTVIFNVHYRYEPLAGVTSDLPLLAFGAFAGYLGSRANSMSKCRIQIALILPIMILVAIGSLYIGRSAALSETLTHWRVLGAAPWLVSPSMRLAASISFRWVLPNPAGLVTYASSGYLLGIAWALATRHKAVARSARPPSPARSEKPLKKAAATSSEFAPARS